MRKNKFRKFLIFILVFAWLFTGYPPIWQNPRIPPKIQKVKAASPEVFSADGTFTASTGIYAVTVECWGGGGGGGSIANNGGGGGGGGAYAKSTAVSVTPGTGYAVDIGTGGASEVAGAASTFNTTTVVAAGGGAAVNSVAGAGGTIDASTGNAIKSAGGKGGDGNTTGDGGGGGGGGGPDGAGKNGVAAAANVSGGGGDGNNSVGTGTGGAAVDGGQGNPGNDDLTHGGGGGAGSEAAQVGGAGGAPGGGGGGGGSKVAGGEGKPGRCIISYTDIWVPSTTLATYSDTWSFATVPTNYSSSQIGMTAATGYDYTGPINYLFTLDNTNCGANVGTGGSSGGWQASTSFSNSGLQPNQCYGYKVTARDSVGTPNTGTVSSISSTYTSANIPGTPVLTSTGATTLALTNDANSNPSTNPITYFAVQIVTTSPSDATWLTKWVDASGNPSGTEVWMTDAALDILVLQGLTGGTTYGAKVKARNQDNDETVLSAEGQGTTLTGVSISMVTDGLIDFNYLAVGGSADTFVLSDPETVSIDSGTANLIVKSAPFIGVGNTWVLGAAPSTDQVLWQFSKDGSAWTDFAVAYSEYTFDTNVVSPATRNLYLRLYMPSLTDSYISHSSVVTIVASSP